MTIPAKKILVLDTETCDLQGNVYDIGWTITNRRGEILDSHNSLVMETFSDPRKMMGAFYADKLFTHYAPMLENGDIVRRPWLEIISTLREHMARHSVNVLAAYNLAFDKRVMAQTHKALGNAGPVLAQPVALLDIWRFACETKLSQRAYARIAREQGWVSDAGNLRTGAQYAYRYCSGDWGFIEDHTALSDAIIETEILAECYRCRKRVPYNAIRDKYSAHPWKIPNTAGLTSGA